MLFAVVTVVAAVDARVSTTIHSYYISYTATVSAWGETHRLDIDPDGFFDVRLLLRYRVYN